MSTTFQWSPGTPLDMIELRDWLANVTKRLPREELFVAITTLAEAIKATLATEEEEQKREETRRLNREIERRIEAEDKSDVEISSIAVPIRLNDQLTKKMQEIATVAGVSPHDVISVILASHVVKEGP